MTSTLNASAPPPQSAATGRDPSSPTSQDRHLPVLDGIRGIAIGLVFWVHFFPRGNFLDRFSGYLWCGVDLFFVLSGFLITGILLRTKDRPAYFKNFYARRALRIFPLYYGVLIAMFVLVPLVIHPNPFPKAFHDQFWFWSYLVNVQAARFDMANAGVRGYEVGTHFWSLAVEEQFYLIWPFVVYFLRKEWVLRVSLAMVLAAPALRAAAWLMGATPTALYVLTPFRMDSLATGAAIAACLAMGKASWLRARVLIPLMLVAGVGGITSIFFSHSSEVFEPPLHLFGFTCNAIFFGGVVALAAQLRPGTATYRILACWPLRMMGKYSYGLYVWHLFVAVIVYKVSQYFSIHSPWGSVAASVIGSTVAAVLSYHLYEVWFLKLKKWF